MPQSFELQLNHNFNMKEFEKVFLGLAQRHSRHNLFDDFLSFSICSYHRTNIQSGLREKDAENEKLYFETIAGYQPDEHLLFSKMICDYMLFVHRNNYEDGFGDFYMEHLSNKHMGQFFTPIEICQLMSRITINESMQNKTIIDPCCGSGRLLLSSAEIAPQNWFFGIDKDLTCAMMSVVNCFLNGLKAEIAWGDTIAMDIYKVWQVNMKGVGILPCKKEDSLAFNYPSWEEIKKAKEESNPKADEMEKKTKEAQKSMTNQLSLF